MSSRLLQAHDLSKQLENDIKHLQLQRELSSASAFISHFDDWQQFVGQHPEKAETAAALIKESLSVGSKKPPSSAVAARADSLKGQVCNVFLPLVAVAFLST